MLTAREIIDMYISFFEKRGHKRIANSPLIPQNDPTTLFTSSGMQPLVTYLLGEPHPQGKRLVNVQSCFRAQDIDEIGDNRHTTFFRMLGNWSLGDYFKKEQLQWFFEFLTKELRLPPEKLYVTVFQGFNDIPQDNEAASIWKKLFESAGIDLKDRIYFYGTSKNWWSRAGEPQNMPDGEPGGPDSEVFYEFDIDHNPKFGNRCHPNCDCGKFLEIGNSVFMQYIRKSGSFEELQQKNVDFGGGLERLLAATENQCDVFQTKLFLPIIQSIEQITQKSYKQYSREMMIINDHFVAASFMAANGIRPSNKEQGYIMRRLIRRGLDGFSKLQAKLQGEALEAVIETIAKQYEETDSELETNFEIIKNTILEESQTYKRTLEGAKKFIQKEYPSTSPSATSSGPSGSGQAKKQGDELMGITEISAEDAFTLYTAHGLSPTQIKSLGYMFNEQAFAEKMKQHQTISKIGAEQKFRGGLADTQEKTIMGHTATHLLHQALRDMFGKQLHQTGSNITTERLRFDFNFNRKLTDEEISKLEQVVNEKIKENLPVHYEILSRDKADKLGAIGLFTDTYADKVKIYFIGGSSTLVRQVFDSEGAQTRGAHHRSGRPYSVEFCGGPHVDFTGRIKRFKIIRQENIGHGQRRIYATVGD